MKRLLILPLLLLLPGWIMIPVGRDTFNSVGLTGDLIKTQFPTRDSVIQAFGPPDWIFFNGRILAYEGTLSDGPKLGLTPLFAYGGMLPLPIGITEPTSRPTRFVFAFDEQGHALGRRLADAPEKPRPGRGIEHLAVRFARRHGIPLESADTGAGPGQATVYFYSEALIATSRARQEIQPVRIQINGRNMLELDAGSLAGVSLAPGSYYISARTTGHFLVSAGALSPLPPGLMPWRRNVQRILLTVGPDEEWLVELPQAKDGNPDSPWISARKRPTERLIELSTLTGAEHVRRSYAQVALDAPGERAVDRTQDLYQSTAELFADAADKLSWLSVQLPGFLVMSRGDPFPLQSKALEIQRMYARLAPILPAEWQARRDPFTVVVLYPVPGEAVASSVIMAGPGVVAIQERQALERPCPANDTANSVGSVGNSEPVDQEGAIAAVFSYYLGRLQYHHPPQPRWLQEGFSRLMSGMTSTTGNELWFRPLRFPAHGSGPFPTDALSPGPPVPWTRLEIPMRKVLAESTRWSRRAWTNPQLREHLTRESLLFAY
ncbi:MAG TPA: hypothetical protein VGA56_11180 [Opitutaceae bacterium]